MNTYNDQRNRQNRSSTDESRMAGSDAFQEELSRAQSSIPSYTGTVDQDLNKGRERADSIVNTSRFGMQQDREASVRDNSPNTQNSVDFVNK